MTISKVLKYDNIKLQMSLFQIVTLLYYFIIVTDALICKQQFDSCNSRYNFKDNFEQPTGYWPGWLLQSPKNMLRSKPTWTDENLCYKTAEWRVVVINNQWLVHLLKKKWQSREVQANPPPKSFQGSMPLDPTILSAFPLPTQLVTERVTPEEMWTWGTFSVWGNSRGVVSYFWTVCGSGHFYAIPGKLSDWN